jgi:hypothetical protein
MTYDPFFQSLFSLKGVLNLSYNHSFCNHCTLQKSVHKKSEHKCSSTRSHLPTCHSTCNQHKSSVKLNQPTNLRQIMGSLF